MNPFSYFASKHLNVFQLKQNFLHHTIHSRYSLIKFLKIYWYDFDVLAFGLQDFQIGFLNFLYCTKLHTCDIFNQLQNIIKIYFLCKLTPNCVLLWIFSTLPYPNILSIIFYLWTTMFSLQNDDPYLILKEKFVNLLMWLMDFWSCCIINPKHNPSMNAKKSLKDTLCGCVVIDNREVIYPCF
jgi:hypothetical protein